MHLILHHASHDIPILAELFGVTTEEFMKAITFDDTLVMSYVLRLIPQGLKPLERRYNGRKRQSYTEVTREADRVLATDYLRRVLSFRCSTCGGDGTVIVEPIGARGVTLAPRPLTCDECEGDGTSWPPPDEYLEYVNGEVKVRRGQKIGTRVRRVLRKHLTTGSKDGQLIDESPDEDEDDGDVEEESAAGTGEDRKPTGLRKWWMKDIDYDYRVKIEDAIGPMPEVTLDDVVPQSAAVTYSAEDADGTMRIYPLLKQQLEAEGLTRIYEIDRDTIPLLVRMMEVGTYFDVPYARKLDARLEVECDQILYQLQQTVGHYVNPASPKQVAELLFDELGLPVVKETKTGQESTQDKVLEDLKLQVAAMPNTRTNRRTLSVLGHITDHRERTKLRGTYTLALPRVVDKNSRIHTTFKSTRTDTNRLSSVSPNLQNIPARTDLGMLVRGAFAAPDGYSLVSVDLSQIEVRVMAHLCGDKNLIAGIKSGVDVHVITASHIFRTTIEKVTKKQRTIAKKITFLILYGGGAARLRAELRLEGIEVTVEETQTYIDAYLKIAYPGIEDFMDEQCSKARRYGYVETLMGWRRYLPGVHSELDGVRMEAERMAVNAPVQGTAAEIMRMACPVLMDETYPKIRKSGYDCDPLLTVHDEVVSQVKVGGEERLAKEIVRAMTGVMELAVPILADWKTAKRWSEAK